MAAGFLRENLGVEEEAEEGLPLQWMTSPHPAQKDSLLSLAIGSQARAAGTLTHSCAVFLGISGLWGHWLPG